MAQSRPACRIDLSMSLIEVVCSALRSCGANAGVFSTKLPYKKDQMWKRKRVPRSMRKGGNRFRKRELIISRR